MEFLYANQFVSMGLPPGGKRKSRGIEPAKGHSQRKKGIEIKHTSSPTLIALPPHPGRRTRSPAWTDILTILPSLSVAPGPTEMTVASGKGEFVADVGRNRPVAVFYATEKARTRQVRIGRRNT
jgi:hypothetical protein